MTSAATTTTRCSARTTTRSAVMPLLSLDDVREGVRRQSLLRRDDGDRLLDARRADRAWRRDVHDDVAAAQPARHRHRRAGDAARTRRARSRCSRPRPTRVRTHPARSRCGARAGTPTSSTSGRRVGGWFRLGLIPNENRAWVNALLCGPGIPTIAVNDFEAALPDDADVREHRCHRTHPHGHRAAADLPRQAARSGPGVRRPVGSAAGRRRATGRAVDGSHLDHGRHAVSVPPDAAV